MRTGDYVVYMGIVWQIAVELDDYSVYIVGDGVDLLVDKAKLRMVH